MEKKYHIPVSVQNDAKCFALGEKSADHGKKFKNIVAVTISTGLRAGIIINEKLYVGYNGGAGEFGEMTFKDQNAEYYCAGKYFIKKYNKSGEELFKEANQNNPKALTIFNEFGHNLGKVLAMVVHAIDPEIIILGGSVSKAYKFFEK
ncbi:ROK family protein [Candidatus Woesearchaeota archaeon]|nr:ROK family protein [Candidatus Woesearchaeota archaeon]